MTEHVDELLAELWLGTLSSALASQVELHLAVCAHCAEEYAAIADTLGFLSLALPPQPGDGTGGAALLAAARAKTAQGGRFYDFLSPVATLLDLSHDRAAELLDRLAAADTYWPPVNLPGAEGVCSIAPPRGPRLDNAKAVVLRLIPGARYPPHFHVGQEQALLLQGGFIDEAFGNEYGVGEIGVCPGGTAHSIRAVPGPDCICIVVIEGGVRLLG